MDKRQIAAITARCEAATIAHEKNGMNAAEFLAYFKSYIADIPVLLDYIAALRRELHDMDSSACEMQKDHRREISRLKAFKEYIDKLYGEGLEVAGWHQNGENEPFDNFYDSAVEEMERVGNG